MHSKTLGRPQGKRSIDKIMKDTSFIVIETTILLYIFWQCYHLSFEVVCIIKNKLSALYHVFNVPSLPICLCLLLLFLVLLLLKSQFLFGIKIFATFVAFLDFVDFSVPDEILSGVKDFGANYARRLYMLLHVLLEQMFVLLSGVANVTNKTVSAMTRVLSSLMVCHIIRVH